MSGAGHIYIAAALEEQTHSLFITVDKQNPII
jgi:hypothetical protein